MGGVGRLAAMLAMHLAGTAATASGSEVLRFDTHGGDAWTFSKVVSGTVIRDVCDTVTLVSGRARVSVQVAQGRFTATIPLRGGRNSVRAICQRKGRQVGRMARQYWIERLPDRPTARATVTVEGSSVLVDASHSAVAPGLAAPLTRYNWRAGAVVGANPVPLELQAPEPGAAAASLADAHGPQLHLRSPRIDGDYRVSLTVTDAAGRSDKSAVVFRVAGGKAITVDALRDHPDWRSCTILYGVAPGLLGRGGLAAITRHLGQISRLGVTALWVSPITDAPPGDFGYSLTDPFRLRADLGSYTQLRALIGRAHALRMRILLDFVTNHLSSRHPYFVDAARFGRRSPYFDWFERDPGGLPVHYFDWSSLENLNYGNAEVRNYVLAGLTHWFRNFSIDGLRADAAWAVRERDPAFWPLMRQDVQHMRPGALLIAEASARDPYYVNHGFDAAYDWTAQLGQWAWQGVFGLPGQVPNLFLLRIALTNDGRGFPDGTGVLRFLNNNDTGKRFITVHGPTDTRLAAVLLLTLPGIPLIYAGDEVGASFEPYAHPPPIKWNDPDHLLPLYTRLTKLRRDLLALRSPTLRLIRTKDDGSVLAYAREGSEPEQDVAVVLNFGASPFALQVASIQARGVSASPWWAQDLLTGRSADAPADAEPLQIAPHSAVLLRHVAQQTAGDNPATVSSSCSP
jgi:cyclomaltodextrinase / maltogenic alpha-amylase / neopullulanase